MKRKQLVKSVCALTLSIATMASTVGSDVLTIFATEPDSGTSVEILEDTENTDSTYSNDDTSTTDDSEVVDNSEVSSTEESVETEALTGYVYVEMPAFGAELTLFDVSDEDGSKVTISNSSEDGKTYIQYADGTVTEVTIDEYGYCLELEEDVGVTLRTELVIEPGFEVSEYSLLSDTGDYVEGYNFSLDEVSPLDSSKLPEGYVGYGFEFAVGEEDVIVSVDTTEVVEEIAESESESETETEIETETETETETVEESESETVQESESETVMESESESETVGESETTDGIYGSANGLTVDEDYIITEFTFETPNITIAKGTLESAIAQLPATVSAIVKSGVEIDIPVSWTCDEDYENTGYNMYTFTSVLPEQYTLGEGLSKYDLPFCFVWIEGVENPDDEIDPIRNYYPIPIDQATMTLPEYLGISSKTAILDHLKSHENDNYYLGTNYNGSVTYCMPNGKATSGQVAGMNCTGFVVEVLEQCGADTSKFPSQSQKYNLSRWINNILAGGMQDQGYPYDGAAYKYVKAYRFNSIQEMLSSGLAKKGDIIIFEAKEDWKIYLQDTDAYGNLIDCHIGFYWGDTPNENKFWHSGHPIKGMEQIGGYSYQLFSPADVGNQGTNSDAYGDNGLFGYVNQISTITPKCDSYVYLFPTEQEDEERYFYVHKTFDGQSASTVGYNPNTVGDIKVTVYTDPQCTQLASIKGDNGQVISGSSVRFGANGNTQWIQVDPGVYYVKETHTVNGVAVSNQVITIDVTDERFATKDSSYWSSASFNFDNSRTPNRYFQVVKTLDGNSLPSSYNPNTDPITIGVYTDQACTRPATTYSQGSNNVFRIESNGKTGQINIAPGVYYVKELSCPSNMQLNTQVFKVDLTNYFGNGTTIETAVQVGPIDNKEIKNGDLWVQKTGTDSSISSTPYYSYAGAIFTAYDSTGRAVAQAVTDGTGYGQFNLITGRSINILNASSAGVSLKTSEDDVKAGDKVTFTIDGEANILRVLDKEGNEIKIDGLDYETPEVNEDGEYIAEADTLDESEAISLMSADEESDEYLPNLSGEYSFTMPESGAVIVVSSTETSDSGISLMGAAPGHPTSEYNMDIPAGTYTVRETQHPTGFYDDYNYSGEQWTVQVSPNNITPVTTNPIQNREITVKINLTKKYNPTCADAATNNPNYSLEGAEYTVYTNRSGNNLSGVVGKITTNGSGWGTIQNLPRDVYYVKETKASNGCAVDNTIYTIDATYATDNAVMEFSVESSETPLMDPVGLLIKKIDSETGEATQSDAGDMAGAEFVVKYYKVDMNMTTDPAAQGFSPAATWHFRTDADGQIMFNSLYLTGNNNSQFYYYNGASMIPYGVVTIQETKAPNGYLLNNTLYVVPINGELNNGVQVTQTKEVPDVALRLDLTKEDATTHTPIPGAVFRHTGPNGFVEDVTTDSNGKISFKGLTHGDHTIQEVSVPDGYALNTNVIKFNVSDTNKITVQSTATETDTDGNITINSTNQGLAATVENKPAPFDLVINKINNKNMVLADAEFTLYSDADCRNEITSAYTDDQGRLIFEDLIPYTDYWVKETDAPPGYRIPVDKNGNPDVYKIRVESSPVNGTFVFKVSLNGQEASYTGTSGQFHINNDVANRQVFMTITNEILGKLPNTGSNMMPIVIGVGAGLIVIAIIASRVGKRKESKGEK